VTSANRPAIIMSGYSAGNGNPFAGLDGLKKAATRQQPQAKKQSNASNSQPATSSSELTPEQAEKRRQKNREKRLRKKKAAAANGGVANGAAGSDDDDSDGEPSESPAASSADQTVPASASSSSPPTPSVSVPPSPSRRARPSPLSVSEEVKRQAAQKVNRVPTPRVGDLDPTSIRSHDDLALQPKVEEESDDEIDSPVPVVRSSKPAAAVIESSSEEESAADSDEEEASEASEASPAVTSSEEEASDEEEEEEEDDDEVIDSQVISLGYSPEVVAAARAQLVSNGIPVDTELLLIAVQEADALAKERASGKITVFKKPPPKPAAKPTPAPAKVAATKTAPVANGKAAPVPAAAKQPASAAASKPVAPVAASAQQTKKAAAALAKEAQAVAAKGKGKAGTDVPASAAEEKPASKTPATKQPPARGSTAAPSTSWDQSSVADLDATAKEWSPSSDPTLALATLNEWCELLEQASGLGLGNKVPSDESLAFAAAFRDSVALESILKTCMKELWSTPTGGVAIEAAKVKQLDSSLHRLFTLTLSGKPADQRFLLDSFKNISKLLQGSTPQSRPLLEEKVLKVLSATRRLTSVHAQISDALKEEEKMEKERKFGQGLAVFGSTSMNGTTKHHSSEEIDPSLVPLQQLSLDIGLLFGESNSNNNNSSTPLKKMWTSLYHTSQSLSHSTSVLSSFSSIIDNSPSTSLQLTFHLLEREIQDRLNFFKKSQEKFTSENTLLIAQRLELEQKKEKELFQLKQQEKEHQTKEKELLKRKSELLNELDRIDTQLKTLEFQKSKTSTSVAGIETQYSKNLSTLTELNSKSHSIESSLKSDIETANKIHSLVIGTYERLDTFNTLAMQKLINSNNTIISGFFSSAKENLLQSNQVQDFLTQRISFVNKKLVNFQQEKIEALKYGIHSLTEPPAESEKSLRETIRQDTKLIQHLKTQSMGLIKKLAKQSFVGLPEDQVISHYTSLLASLDLKKVGEFVDLKPLREHLEKLKDKATPSPATATANGTSSTQTEKVAPAQPHQTTVQKQAKAASAATAAVLALANAPAPAAAPVAVVSPPAAKPTKGPMQKSAGSKSAQPAPTAATPAAVVPVASKPAPTPAPSDASTIDPFTGLEALPQRAPKRKERGNAKAAASTESTPAPAAAAVETPAAKGDAAANGNKKGKGKKAAPTAANTSVAATSPLPSAPVKTWSTTMKPVAPSTGDDAFPALSAATLEQAKQQERVAKKAIVSPSPSPAPEKSPQPPLVEEKKSE
jgi:hypothetical protein